MAGIIFTWPMAPDFFSSIPYTLRPIPGFERVPLMPGDHLQTYYWFWLLSDNLFGHSALFTNPYEFNGPSGPMSTVYANFPYSLLYITLLFLGPVGAYNGLILLSFMLCGLAMFLLARSWTKDFWASLMAGLIFTVAPFRVSHIAGGQLPGYVIFLLPLCLYYIERTLITGRWRYGWAGGLCLVLLSLMDPHTSFLAALTLGIYLPSRILLFQPFPLSQAGETRSFWPGFLGAFIGGLSISFFLWIRFGIKDGHPFLINDLLQPFLLGMVSTRCVMALSFRLPFKTDHPFFPRGPSSGRKILFLFSASLGLCFKISGAYSPFGADLDRLLFKPVYSFPPDSMEETKGSSSVVRSAQDYPCSGRDRLGFGVGRFLPAAYPDHGFPAIPGR